MNEYVCACSSHDEEYSYDDYCINNGHTPIQMCLDEHICISMSHARVHVCSVKVSIGIQLHVYIVLVICVFTQSRGIQ